MALKPFGSYQEAIAWLFKQLPMFTRDGASAYKEGLGNILTLCERLGNPQNSFQSIHVAGTNGKGSTSHSIAAVLQSAGYKVGLYTSPHLKDFRERIRINGLMIDSEKVLGFINNNLELIEIVQPSFFEISVAMAFDFFAKEELDIAVVEVGMGGRLDSTNIITPVLSVITSISYDHKQFLGDTLPKIAGEKAGIIKQNVPVIISSRQPEVSFVFKQKAKEMGAPIFWAWQNWKLQPLQESNLSRTYGVTHQRDGSRFVFESDLPGEYQLENLAGVLEVLFQLREIGFSIPFEAVQLGLSTVKSATGLKGRWQVVGQTPTTICDTGHNPDGIRFIMSQLSKLVATESDLYLVLGFMKDKDLEEIAQYLPKGANYFPCQPDLPRAKPFDELATWLVTKGLKVCDSHPMVPKAIEMAKGAANPIRDIVFIGGSTFVVAEIPNL